MRLTKWGRSILAGSILLASSAAGTHAATPISPRQGFVQVPGGPVWYRIFGSGTKTPLLILHGGPGGTSCAFEPLATLVSADRPVIVYDQLGSGRSGRPLDESLWTVQRSRKELAAVRNALGLTRVHLMGTSWGSGLAADYVLTERPAGVESLVLSGPFLSTRMWIADADVLRKQLPKDVQETLTRNEAANTIHSKEYLEATQVFYSHFLYHGRKPEPPPSCADAPSNNTIYELMWGPTEFHATGRLLSFDVTGDLHKLSMPVMLIAGRYDEARPETVEKFHSMIPGSRVAIMENSGHLAPLEEFQRYAQVLGAFLNEVDKGVSRQGAK
ncbi:MAG: proline iminopeptidase-family hydrolase [Proteobacteria bacterium]|nr:proline iminopeptidase-family hydrolase [Pseudomonadota bacterium]